MHTLMDLRNTKGNGDETVVPNCAVDAQCAVAPGSVIEINGKGHRIVAVIKKRVLAADLRTHHIYLVQDGDGSLQLPKVSLMHEMIERGHAVAVTELVEPSATERMRVQIEMLDAAAVPQGDKAIWIFMATHWTPALEAAFGHHDEPWKIRRWRADLRKAVEDGPSS